MKFDSLEAFKKHFPIVLEIPVAWGEMDSMQHVNHTVYLKWMETARFEFFEMLGMMELMQESGVGNILKSIECRYRIPLVPRARRLRQRRELPAAGHRLRELVRRAVPRRARLVQGLRRQRGGVHAQGRPGLGIGRQCRQLHALRQTLGNRAARGRSAGLEGL